MAYKHIGICYHGLNPEAGELARAIADRIGPGRTVATANQDELDINPDALSGPTSSSPSAATGRS